MRDQNDAVHRVDPDPARRPIWPGTSGPSSGSPRRADPSLRRTTCVDIVFPSPGVLELHGSGRDLLTIRGVAAVVDTAETVVTVDLETRTVTSVGVRPAPPGWDPRPFEGLPASGKFRKAIAVSLPHAVAGGMLVAQLLDETPVTTLIAGSSLGRRGLIRREPGTPARPMLDICSGWVSGGLMAEAATDESDSDHYMGEGPPAPPLDEADDPIGWHDLATLEPGSMRRRRRLDIAPSASGHGYRIDAMFRDSYIEPDGAESAVHEYAIGGTTDADGIISALIATPRVLPGPECPRASASAGRLVGVALREVRSRVSSQFVGTSTCTHLNDALRSVGDLGHHLHRFA